MADFGTTVFRVSRASRRASRRPKSTKSMSLEGMPSSHDFGVQVQEAGKCVSNTRITQQPIFSGGFERRVVGGRWKGKEGGRRSPSFSSARAPTIIRVVVQYGYLTQFAGGLCVCVCVERITYCGEVQGHMVPSPLFCSSLTYAHAPISHLLPTFTHLSS